MRGRWGTKPNGMLGSEGGIRYESRAGLSW